MPRSTLRTAKPGDRGLGGASIALAIAFTGLVLGARDRAVSDHEQDLPRSKDDTGPGAAMREPGRGRTADAPHHIPAGGWKDILWRTWNEIQEDRVVSIAAGVTFYALLALFPAVAALVAIYGLFADPATIQSHLEQVKGILPYGATDIIGEQLKSLATAGSGKLGFAFAAGLLISLWSANSGVKAMFDALNIAYGEKEQRSFLKLNAISLLFTLGAIVTVLLGLVVIAVVPLLLKLFLLGGFLEPLIRVGRWVLMLVAVALLLAVLYRFGPSRREPQWRWVSVGSAVATVVWLAASWGLSIYAQNFANYDKTYGSLGAVVGLMFWMWVSTIVVLVGAVLNAEIEHQTERDTTTGGDKPLGARGARMADTVGKAAD